MDCRIADPETNFAQAAMQVAEAARRGSDLVLLPELWSTAYALDQAAALA
ncbi:MAG: carbon-nitrogen family hydrolase, partial [Caldilineaceae bacterium]|nr:carbon-nitrogen family hydrolase [Caldilineaceae bacterium]